MNLTHSSQKKYKLSINVLTSLTIMELQIKLYSEVPCTPSQMAITSKTNAKKDGGVISRE